MLRDKDIRESLFEFLEETYGKVRIIEEKTMGRSRADVVMVTEGHLTGIEIKSDADTYARLERQVKDYNRYFDFNIIVVGTSHAHHVKQHIPEYWGVITVEEVDGKPDFYIYREGTPNPKREKRVKLRNQLSFLWRPELASLLEMYGLPKYTGKSKLFVIEKLIDRVSEEDLKYNLSDILFERDYRALTERIREYKLEQHRKRTKYKGDETMQVLCLEYPRCGTCKKALKWLKENGVEFEDRDISLQNPNKEELKKWHGMSGQPLKKFFNTSGQIYRSMGLKDALADMSEEQQLELLSTNGMLVKRPLIVTQEKVLVGFKEKEWEETLLPTKE